MSRIALSAAWLSTALLATSVVGCGPASSEVPVQGHVSYQGQPIAHGALMFFPGHGRAIASATDSFGDYAVNLAPGEYAVTVNLSVRLPEGWKEGDPIPQQKIILPAKYTTRIKTPLQATVTPSGAEPTDFYLP